MGILSRFGDIMRANINDLLTGAENKNAEKLLNQYLRDAREDYAQVKSETASVMAEEAAAKRRLDEINDQIARYERYAQAAVQAGNDADALKFLEAKGQLQPKKEDAEAAYGQAKLNSEHMRQLTKKLLAEKCSSSPRRSAAAAPWEVLTVWRTASRSGSMPWMPKKPSTPSFRGIWEWAIWRKNTPARWAAPLPSRNWKP